MNPGANPRVTVSVLDIRRGTKWLRMTVVLWYRIEKNDEGSMVVIHNMNKANSKLHKL